MVMMTLDHRQNHLQSIRDGLSLVVYPLQLLVNLPFAAVDWSAENLSSRRTLLILPKWRVIQRRARG